MFGTHYSTVLVHNLTGHDTDKMVTVTLWGCACTPWHTPL